MWVIVLAALAKVSIPLKSGHIVTKYSIEYLPQDVEVSIPLKSGHIVTTNWCGVTNNILVSIPLKSGHIVTNTE